MSNTKLPNEDEARVAQTLGEHYLDCTLGHDSLLGTNLYVCNKNVSYSMYPHAQVSIFILNTLLLISL